MKKWFKDNCHKEALKFSTKSEFEKKSNGAYQAMLRNNWQDELCSHMITIGSLYKRMIYRIIFTENICYVGLTCNISRRIYDHLNHKGVVFEYIKKTKLIPTVEYLTDYIDIEKAKKLEEYWKNKSEEQGFKCLNIAKTGGIGGHILKWNKLECQKEALKYKSRSDFMVNSHSAYNSALKNKWLDEICSHMIILKHNWTKNECQKEALKYKTRSEFEKNNHNMWYFAKNHKWLDEICSHMVILKHKWTKNECQKEALKYTSRNKFKKYNHSVWQFAQKHKWLDDICSHMIQLRHWSIEECEIEASKYKNKTDFSRKNHNMYEFARSRKWLDKIFKK